MSPAVIRCFCWSLLFISFGKEKCYTFVAYHYATLTMNLVSRKMVIEELKDKFLVRRTRMEVGKLGKPHPLLNLAYVGV
ncbi:hypothetical protein AWP77_03270 [Escherichia coli]|nr:hypothetical protein AWP77_03290 [Escherichia coli]OKW43077.1 hypothetical protein AWP77_03270 [Escherichia coli]OKW55670.1 hypothetical protein AWP76_08285 [Escherichia coli]